MTLNAGDKFFYPWRQHFYLVSELFFFCGWFAFFIVKEVIHLTNCKSSSFILKKKQEILENVLHKTYII